MIDKEKLRPTHATVRFSYACHARLVLASSTITYMPISPAG